VNMISPSGVPSGVRRPSGALISYANEPEGRRMALALRAALHAQGCTDVVIDDDLPRRNPTSVAAWMEEQIFSRVVLCVLTPGYLLAAEEEAPKRKGVRYELRAIQLLIYDHEGRYDCPVIPVAPPGFPIEETPQTLRSLNISWFDPEDGNGADQLAERIAALEGMGGSVAMNVRERVPPSDGSRRFREVLHELEESLTAEHAIALVGECLRLAEDLDLSVELVPAFPRLADVIKDHGQVSLMRVLTDRCLAALNGKTPLLHWERRLLARLLICGKAWYLQRDHRLREALDHAREGIRLAEQCDDRRTAAYGRQCVGRIQRLLAEDADGADIDHYLGLSSRTIREAVALFQAIDGDRPRRSEAGACLSLGARTELTRYRLLGDRAALTAADELAAEAGRMLPVGQKKDNYDLAILRAEIAGANRRYAMGRKLLSDVIEAVMAERGEQSEILARAYVARAYIAQLTRSPRGEIFTDLMKARQIFESQGLSHAVAARDWTMLTIDPRRAPTPRFGRDDIAQLERLTADPRLRLAAIAKLAEHPEVGQRRVDWAALVERSR
jgi:hypothetical protein